MVEKPPREEGRQVALGKLLNDLLKVAAVGAIVVGPDT
jgi:hypothetical protein